MGLFDHSKVLEMLLSGGLDFPGRGMRRVAADTLTGRRMRHGFKPGKRRSVHCQASSHVRSRLRAKGFRV